MRKRLLIIVAIGGGILLSVLLVLRPRTDPEAPLPNPNGYEDLVLAGRLVEPNPPDWRAMKGEARHVALLGLVATNQPALDLARAGLAKECRMVPWEMDATNSAHLDDLARTRALAQAFAGASQLALIEGRTNEASSLAIDCIRFGSESVRGGVLLDGLLGLAIKALGLGALSDAIPGLDFENTRKALAALLEVEKRGESGDDFVRREHQWARRGRFGPTGFLAPLVQPFVDRKLLASARAKFMKGATDMRRVEIRLAMHAYELDQGRPPSAMAELIPEYLQAVPLDAATGLGLPLE